VGVDQKKFGKYVEKTKEEEMRRGSENYTYEELVELAREFKELENGR
jgi:hypothetical protein